MPCQLIRPARAFTWFGPGVDGSSNNAAFQRCGVILGIIRTFARIEAPFCLSRLDPLFARTSLVRGPSELQAEPSASLRFWFPSASANRARLFPKAAGLWIIPLRRSIVLAVLSATPLCRRLTSVAPATVDRNRSCVTGLFLGNVPLSRSDWHRSGRFAPPNLLYNEGRGTPSTTLLGFV